MYDNLNRMFIIMHVAMLTIGYGIKDCFSSLPALLFCSITVFKLHIIKVLVHDQLK